MGTRQLTQSWRWDLALRMTVLTGGGRSLTVARRCCSAATGQNKQLCWPLGRSPVVDARRARDGMGRQGKVSKVKCQVSEGVESCLVSSVSLSARKGSAVLRDRQSEPLKWVRLD